MRNPLPHRPRFPGDIFLPYGAAAPRDFIVREKLHYLQKRHPNVQRAAAYPVLENAAHWMATGFEIGGSADRAKTRFVLGNVRGMADDRGWVL